MIVLLKLYQWVLSPIFTLLGASCKFEPSCSQYAIEAVRKHGHWRGSRLALRRLAKCHPLSSRGGYDPVP